MSDKAIKLENRLPGGSRFFLCHAFVGILYPASSIAFLNSSIDMPVSFAPSSRDTFPFWTYEKVENVTYVEMK